MIIDYKNTKVTIPLALAVTIALSVGGFWLNASFLSKANAEETLDHIYLRQDTAAQTEKNRQGSSDKKEIRGYRREILKINGAARRDDRPQFAWEKDQIDLLESYIKDLGGMP